MKSFFVLEANVGCTTSVVLLKGKRVVNNGYPNIYFRQLFLMAGIKYLEGADTIFSELVTFEW